ncbi:MAG: hypothetical protein ACREBZ_02855 [Thermoplasmata archaeon]
MGRPAILDEAIDLTRTAEAELRAEAEQKGEATRRYSWKEVRERATRNAVARDSRSGKPRLAPYIQSSSPRTIQRWRGPAQQEPEVPPGSAKNAADDTGVERVIESPKDRKRRRLQQLEAHSKDLGAVLRQPEVLLGSNPLGTAIDLDLVNRTRAHLSSAGAYPKILAACDDVRAAEAERNKLEGKPNFIAALYSAGPRLVEGEAGQFLLKKIRDITRKFYPGIPEQPEHGPLTPPCTFPTQIAQDLWRQVGALEGGGSHFIKVSSEPFNGRWKVGCIGTAYAIVDEERQCKVTGLETALQRLAESSELRRMYRKVRDAEERVSTTAKTFSDLARNLGKELGYGDLIRGTCGFVFEESPRESEGRIALANRGVPPSPVRGPADDRLVVR